MAPDAFADRRRLAAVAALVLLLASCSGQPCGRAKRQVASSPPSVLGFLSDLGPQLSQMNQAKSVAALLGSSSASQPAGGGPAEPAGPPSASLIVSSFNSLARSLQDGNAKTLADLTQTAQSQKEQADQQAVGAAQQAQSGFKAALSEIGQGLQKIASNNPSLLPDVKNLYQSVSSKLSAASSSVAPAASPQQAQAQSQITEALKQGIQAPAS